MPSSPTAHISSAMFYSSLLCSAFSPFYLLLFSTIKILYSRKYAFAFAFACKRKTISVSCWRTKKGKSRSFIRNYDCIYISIIFIYLLPRTASTIHLHLNRSFYCCKLLELAFNLPNRKFIEQICQIKFHPKKPPLGAAFFPSYSSSLFFFLALP